MRELTLQRRGASPQPRNGQCQGWALNPALSVFQIEWNGCSARGSSSDKRILEWRGSLGLGPPQRAWPGVLAPPQICTQPQERHRQRAGWECPQWTCPPGGEADFIQKLVPENLSSQQHAEAVSHHWTRRVGAALALGHEIRQDLSSCWGNKEDCPSRVSGGSKGQSVGKIRSSIKCLD